MDNRKPAGKGEHLHVLPWVLGSLKYTLLILVDRLWGS